MPVLVMPLMPAACTLWARTGCRGLPQILPFFFLSLASTPPIFPLQLPKTQKKKNKNKREDSTCERRCQAHTENRTRAAGREGTHTESYRGACGGVQNKNGGLQLLGASGAVGKHSKRRGSRLPPAPPISLASAVSFFLFETCTDALPRAAAAAMCSRTIKQPGGQGQAAHTQRRANLVAFPDRYPFISARRFHAASSIRPSCLLSTTPPGSATPLRR